VTSNNPVPWESLETRSSTAFIVGGVLWLGFTVYNLLKVMNVVVEPPTIVNDALILGGFLAAFLGLFGFYFQVADDSPRLARGGAVIAAIGAIALPVDRGVALFTSLTEGTPFGEVTTGLEPLYMVTFFGAVIAFLLFGTASLRAHTPSRTVGLLLVVPPVMLLTYLFGGAFVSWSGFVLVVWAVIAVGWLALGHRLRTEGIATDSAAATADSPA
jgi:hypothetical protein